MTITTTTIPVTDSDVVGLTTHVVNTFTGLMTKSIGTPSIAATAIQKIKAITIDVTSVPNAEFHRSERAKLLVDTMKSVVVPLTSAALKQAVALEIAAVKNKYVAYKALVDTQAKDVAAEKALKNAEKIELDADRAKLEALLLQAKLRVDTGVNPGANAGELWTGVEFDPWTIGMVYNSLGVDDFKYGLTRVQYSATLAKAYRENGNITNITTVPVDTTVTATNGVYASAPEIVVPWYEFYPHSDLTQQEWFQAGTIANQTRTQYLQYKGFDMNKWQHVLNAAANATGVIIAADEAATEAWADVTNQWLAACRLALNTETLPTYDPVNHTCS